MTLQSFPFDNQSTSEIEYSKLFRELQSSGVVGSVGSSGLAVSIDGRTQLTLAVAPGSAIIRGHMVMSVDTTTSETLTLAAVVAGTGSQRIDTVVARLNPAANLISLAVVQGTSTTAGALTQTDTDIYELALATVIVGASKTLAVQDARTFTGAHVGAWTTATRPAAPRIGKLGWNTTLQAWEFWSGAAWQPLLPVDTGWVTAGVVGVNAAGSTTGTKRSVPSGVNLRRVGDSISINFTYRLGDDITVGGTGNVTNTPLVLLPAAFRPVVGQTINSGGLGGVASYVVTPTGLVYLAAVTPNLTLTGGATSGSVSGMILGG